MLSSRPARLAPGRRGDSVPAAACGKSVAIPKQIEEGFTFIAKCMCGETGMSWGGGTLQYSRTNKWENDTCVTKERWERRLGGKWVEVTEVEYNKLLEVKPKRKTKRRRQR